jgi:large subunit ribosomal protein L25
MKKLTLHSRKDLKKSETNRIRREGDIPGVLYGQKGSNERIFLKGDELKAILRDTKNGPLATTLFELHEGKRVVKAIIKEIQYHPANYSILHIDFATIAEDRPVTVNVPIQVTGAAECAGIKLGGFLRQAIRTLKVTCLPKDMPQAFTLDVRELGVAQSKRLSDIEIPSSVKPRARMDEVAVVIAKKL